MSYTTFQDSNDEVKRVNARRSFGKVEYIDVNTGKVWAVKKRDPLLAEVQFTDEEIRIHAELHGFILNGIIESA